MAEPTIGAHTYRIGKASAMDQFHVSRRLAPIQIALGISMSDMMRKAPPLVAQVEAAENGEPPPPPPDFMLGLAGPVVQIISKMTDEEVEYVIHKALAHIHRKVPGAGGNFQWAPMLNGKALMFQDLTMPEMIQLVQAFIRENLEGFFPLPSDEETSNQPS